MRKTKKSYPLTEIYNLGSPNAHLLDFTREKLWKRMDPVMFKRACSIPVFLVNLDQMDKLYPPEKELAVPPKYVKEWIKSKKEKEQKKGYEDEERDEFEELDKMAERYWSYYKETVAVSVYVENIVYEDILSTIPKNKFTSQEVIDHIKKPNGPAIFICPERVINWAKRKNFPTEIVLDKVYYHELGHAIMDYGDIPYEKFWARTVEESLANAIAFNTFKSPYERGEVISLIEDQPAEYQTYHWFSSLYISKIDEDKKDKIDKLIHIYNKLIYIYGEFIRKLSYRLDLDLDLDDVLIYPYHRFRYLYPNLLYLFPIPSDIPIFYNPFSWIIYKSLLKWLKVKEKKEEEKKWKQFVKLLLELTFGKP